MTNSEIVKKLTRLWRKICCLANRVTALEEGGGGGGAAARFGVAGEDDLATQPRYIFLDNNNFDIVSGTEDFSGPTSEIYMTPNFGVSMDNYDDPDTYATINVATGNTALVNTDINGFSNIQIIPWAAAINSQNATQWSALHVEPDGIRVKFADTTGDGFDPMRFLPISVNGNFADSTGNITIAGVSIPATAYDTNADAVAALGVGVMYKSTTLINGSPIILITQ